MIRLQSKYYNVMVTHWLVTVSDMKKSVSKAAGYSMSTWCSLSDRYVTSKKMGQIIS
jgi:hypothetical protein